MKNFHRYLNYYNTDHFIKKSRNVYEVVHIKFHGNDFRID